MTDQRVRTALSWILLSGFVLVTSLARGVYAAHDMDPSGRFQLLEVLGLLMLLWYWFAQQVAPHRPPLVMDLGVLMAALWFVLVPYYLWRYERWRGLGTAAALFGLFAAGWAASLAAYLLLSQL